jgi:hypothetical protein
MLLSASILGRFGHACNRPHAHKGLQAVREKNISEKAVQKKEARGRKLRETVAGTKSENQQ